MIYITALHAGVTIGIENQRYTVSEGSGRIEVCCIMTNKTLERKVNFTLSTEDGEATSTDPTDFSAVSVELQFNKTTSKQCVDIPITDDSKVEHPENFIVVIGSDDLKAIVNVSKVSTITITDDDKVTIEFEREQYQGEEGVSIKVCAVLRNATLERLLVTRLQANANIGMKLALYIGWPTQCCM